jgi:hypothetical protein
MSFAPNHPSEAAPVPAPRRALHGPTLTRLYQIAWTRPDGSTGHRCTPAPALPEIEAAFSALARGSLVETPSGPVAVEDLRPGQPVLTDAGREALVWIGSITLFPAAAHPRAAPARLVRVLADGFGPGRPAADLVLGPGARVVTSPRDRRPRPAAALADGFHAVEIAPVSGLAVFHLATAAPRLVQVGGFRIATLDPAALLGGPAGGLCAALFPHCSEAAQGTMVAAE